MAIRTALDQHHGELAMPHDHHLGSDMNESKNR